MAGHKISLLGTGLIGRFYTQSLHSMRSKDRVYNVYSRNIAHAKDFAEEWKIEKYTDSMRSCIDDPDTDTVIVALPNFLHKEAVLMTAKAGKNVLCTKPLGRDAKEAMEMLKAVERAGVFSAYLEDLVYTPKTLKSLHYVKNGSLGKVMWVRSRETHPGPHSAWFWDKKKAGGGAIIDMGCHCVEIIRNFIGKDIKPIEVLCWSDTLVHNISSEDNGIGLIKFQNGAIGQFEVSWTFRGGMDLRDEVAGTEGTIWLDHFLRTGFEMFTKIGLGGYVAEKAEQETGWLFPVGDEVNELGYSDMFVDVFNAIDSKAEPMETFYDGYVVNEIIDACYRSAKEKAWVPITLDVWRGKDKVEMIHEEKRVISDKYELVKEERMPNGDLKLILRDKSSGAIIEQIEKDK